jgi:hypothetical protein
VRKVRERRIKEHFHIKTQHVNVTLNPGLIRKHEPVSRISGNRKRIHFSSTSSTLSTAAAAAAAATPRSWG